MINFWPAKVPGRHYIGSQSEDYTIFLPLPLVLNVKKKKDEYNQNSDL